MKPTKRGVFGIAAVCLASMLTPAGAHADPDDPGQSQAQPDPNAEYLAGWLGISLEEAAQRSLMQDTWANFTDEVQTDHPDVFAGAVIETATTGRLTLLSTDPDLDIGPEAEKWNVTGLVDIVPATYTFDELHAASDELNALLPDDGVVVEGTSFVPNALNVTLSLTDGHREQIQAVLDDFRADRPGILSITDVDRPVSRKDRGMASCSSSAPVLRCNDQEGGIEIEGVTTKLAAGATLAYGSSTSNILLPCSAGFNVVGASGTPYILTAGHCVQSSSYWYQTKPNQNTWNLDPGTSANSIGPSHAGAVTTGGDWGLVKATPWAGAAGEIIKLKTNYSTVYGPNVQDLHYSINGIGTFSAGLVGDSICHTGRSTGSSCGKVTSITWTVWGNIHATGREVDFRDPTNPTTGPKAGQVCQGDSGGPVFRNNLGYGLTSGFPIATGSIGSPVAPPALGAAYECSDYMIYVSLAAAIGAYSITLATP